MQLLFLDESGDHSLDIIDWDYPVFVLGGVVIDRGYYRAEVEPRVQDLKKRYVETGVVLHTTDIIRARNGFEALVDPTIRTAFLEDLNALMKELDYTVIACAILKRPHKERYGSFAADPYHLSLEILLDRFVRIIGEVEHGGLIFAEQRRPDLDRALQDEWNRLRQQGCSSATPEQVDGRIVDLSMKDKRSNLAGLELADLVVSPIGRHVIGKPDRDDWRIVESKLEHGRKRDDGEGLVILPSKR